MRRSRDQLGGNLFKYRKKSWNLPILLIYRQKIPSRFRSFISQWEFKKWQGHPTNLFPRGILLAGKILGVPMAGWEIYCCWRVRLGMNDVFYHWKPSLVGNLWKGKVDPPPLPPLKGRFEAFCHANFDVRWRKLWFFLLAGCSICIWLQNQPILSSWLGNFLCVLLGKRNR